MTSDKPHFWSSLRRNMPANLAFKSPRAIVLFLLVTTASLAGDLVSKQYVFDSILSSQQTRQELEEVGPFLPDDARPQDVLHLIKPRHVAPGVQWRLSTNSGIVFGLAMPRSLVAAATICSIFLVTGMFALSSRRAWVVHLALAFILAGALGNLYDRLFSLVELPLDSLEPIRYHVRDFIDLTRIRIGDIYYRWIFNIADVLLVIGVAVLLVHQFKTKKTRKEEPQS